MTRSHLGEVGRVVGGAVLCAAAVGLSAPIAAAASPVSASTVAPDPAAAQLAPPVTGSVGGSAGLYAVAGGLVVVTGGSALWLRRKRAGKVTIH